MGPLTWGADGEEKSPRRQGADATSTGADPGLEDKGVLGTSSLQEHQNSETINSSFLGAQSDAEDCYFSAFVYIFKSMDTILLYFLF